MKMRLHLSLNNCAPKKLVCRPPLIMYIQISNDLCSDFGMPKRQQHTPIVQQFVISILTHRFTQQKGPCRAVLPKKMPILTFGVTAPGMCFIKHKMKFESINNIWQSNHHKSYRGDFGLSNGNKFSFNVATFRL